jgi:hypothetical protein
MQNILLLLSLALCISCGTQKKAIVATEIAKEKVTPLADEPEAIANWTFNKEQTAEPNNYLITAHLKLSKHWHIFDFEPGGDGLLIAPEFNFDNENVTIVKKEAQGELINAQVSGMGNVRYYENEVSFKVLIRSNTEAINGSVYYQLCDETKCIAPTEEPFNL